MMDDITKILSNITIVVDTREKEWKHIQKYFDDNKIKYIRKRLDYGDYSFILNIDNKDVAFKDMVVIERKRNWSELEQNFTKHYDRFANEFDKISNNKVANVLLIEDSLNNLYNGKYRGNYSPKSFEGMLWTWMWKYNCIPIFCQQADTGRTIYRMLYLYGRRYLKLQQVKNRQ